MAVTVRAAVACLSRPALVASPVRRRGHCRHCSRSAKVCLRRPPGLCPGEPSLGSPLLMLPGASSWL
eukprot:14975041-Alexandrium_andersonii.AAC.1